MPALSSTMKEGKLSEWLTSEGSPISSGDSIATIESDKADMDLEAFADGTLLKILVEEGETAKVGEPIAVILEEGEEEVELMKLIEGGGGTEPVVETQEPASSSSPPPVSASTEPQTPHTKVYMPALSSTMTSGKVVSWEVDESGTVGSGEPLLTVESDKADMEVEHLGDDGFLARICVEEGASCDVGEVVAVIVENEEDVAKWDGWMPGASVSAPSPSPASPAASKPAAAAKAPSASSPAPSGGRVIASPLAKKVAKDKNIDLSQVTGTGPEGRITVSDVEGFTAGSPPKKKSDTPPVSSWKPANGVVAATPMARALAKKSKIDLSTISGTGQFGRVTEADVKSALGESPKKKKVLPGVPAVELPSGFVKYSGMQSAVSTNMEATLTVPIFRVSSTIEMNSFNKLYASVKPNGVTLTVLISKAVSIAIQKHPIMNSRHDSNGGIYYNSDINIANAVALDGGLITPVMKNTNEKSLEELGEEWRDLVSKAREGKLKPDEFNSGTFAITNLGMFGVTAFDAILPPNTGTILALGATTEVIRPCEECVGGMRKVKEMTVTVTCDHRPIYGSDAAIFLKTLKEVMENPEKWGVK
ncbi:hypothetical protein TrST_g14334 [Triparma strigata]|uniref:Dihydrolipoamide acetyltransferase component of pyruvate dehydrogenase complex n=1 Tax=Triparma strigata TaxID=1606541 RepID=A0A9W7AKV3_9STRA|nr:hypothetical protein TrST_g14334 [Triparma strigata]